MGVEATINKLAAHDLTWPTMREDVLTFIGRCPACQKMSQLKHHIHMSPFTTVSYGPMNRLNIDSIGPFPVDEAGNKYIITIIDAFTLWCMLIPIVDATAISAADALVKWMGTFGIPSSIVSDNVNSLVPTLLDLLYIQHNRINAYSHEENAIVERANKEVQRHLSAILYERHSKRKWSTSLPLVQRIMNAQVHFSIGVSLAQILFGNTVDLDRNFLSTTRDLKEQPLDDYLIELLTLPEQVTYHHNKALTNFILQCVNQQNHSQSFLPTHMYWLPMRVMNVVH